MPQHEIVIRPPDSKGLWLRTHLYREGCMLHLDAYAVMNGVPKVYKASVDLVPIYRAVKKLHAELHAKSLEEKVGIGALEIRDLASPADYYDLFDDDLEEELNDDFVQSFDAELEDLGEAESLISGAQITIGWNPFKKIARAVKKIGRSKLLKSVSRQVKSIATSPAFQAVSIASAAIPGVGPAVYAGTQGLIIAANLASKKKSGLIKAVASVVSAQVTGTDVTKITDAAGELTKVLPKSSKKDAVNIIKKAAQLGGGVKGLTKALPKNVRKEWTAALVKGAAAEKALKKAGVKSLASLKPNTAFLAPRVSDQALGAYSVATKALSALRQEKMLRRAIKSGQLGMFGKLTPGTVLKISKNAANARKVLNRVKQTRKTDPAAARAWQVFEIVNRAQNRTLQAGRRAVSIGGVRKEHTMVACIGGQLVEVGCSCSRNDAA